MLFEQYVFPGRNQDGILPLTVMDGIRRVAANQMHGIGLTPAWSAWCHIYENQKHKRATKQSLGAP